LLQAKANSYLFFLATLLVNSRHLVMSATLAARLPEKRSWLILPAAFGVTDETFAVAATREQNFGPVFLISLGATAYSGWVGGTVAGHLLGTTLPTALQNSMGIALYAMFAALLIPGFKKNRHALFLAAGAGIFHAVLTWGGLFSPGWNLIAAMVFSAVLGACFFKEKGE
jgi:predicted branched-subunit amino acid permease